MKLNFTRAAFKAVVQDQRQREEGLGSPEKAFKAVAVVLSDELGEKVKK